MLNRAIAGEYPTGSTFKTVDTIAGLQTGVLSQSTTLDAPATYTNHGLVWHDWNPNGHGVIDLSQALVQSADIYFYQVGYDFYLRKGTELKTGRRPGLRARDGHRHSGRVDGRGAHAVLAAGDLHQEDRPDQLADRQPLEAGQLDQPGDRPGDLLATPLQVAVNYAAIANGGYVVTPHLGLRVDSPQGTTLQTLKFPAPRSLGIASGNLAFLRGALRAAASTPAGTSYRVFGSYPVAVAGKTGTAQVAGKGDYPRMRVSRRPTIPSTSWSS